MDGEIGVAWYHAEEIIHFRLLLWHEHLGPDLDLIHLDWRQFVNVWSARALRNATRAPPQRPGLAIPYPLDTAPQGLESPLDPRLMNIMARGFGDETAGYRSAGLAAIKRWRARVS
ncbi:MAG: hypothetical protein M3461_21255 [Pseudomonadota bacterium]|nr:hypothetical protein [Pseudomonadota bacterium]